MPENGKFIDHSVQGDKRNGRNGSQLTLDQRVHALVKRQYEQEGRLSRRELREFRQIRKALNYRDAVLQSMPDRTNGHIEPLASQGPVAERVSTPAPKIVFTGKP